MDSLVFQSLELTGNKFYNLPCNTKSLLVYDIQTKVKFELGHTEGSTYTVCNFHNIQTNIPDIPPHVKIIVIDENGNISAESTAAMRSFGFDSHFLKNGIKGWKGKLDIIISGKVHSPTFCIRHSS